MIHQTVGWVCIWRTLEWFSLIPFLSSVTLQEFFRFSCMYKERKGKPSLLKSFPVKYMYCHIPLYVNIHIDVLLISMETLSLGKSPCPMRMKPVMVMIIRARILATVKTSWILVAARTLTKLTKVNIPKNRKVNHTSKSNYMYLSFTLLILSTNG